MACGIHACVRTRVAVRCLGRRRRHHDHRHHHHHRRRRHHHHIATTYRQATGAWTPAEHARFLARLAELGGGTEVDLQWGVFSMAIPGRVGYQCSNYYRKLVERGEIRDPNYVLDGDGRAHFLRVKNPDGKSRTPRPRAEGPAAATATAMAMAAAGAGLRLVPRSFMTLATKHVR